MKQYKPSGKAIKYKMPVENKRIPLSMIRLYKLAQKFMIENSNSNTAGKYIIQFLEYTNNHKNDIL